MFVVKATSKHIHLMYDWLSGLEGAGFRWPDEQASSYDEGNPAYPSIDLFLANGENHNSADQESRAGAGQSEY